VSAPDPSFAPTPEPPYWVVVFTSRRNGRDEPGYSRTADAMAALAARQPGYLGMESVRGADGVGITLSYWTSEEAIATWKAVAAHAEAQRHGRAEWYEDYVVRVAHVTRQYTMSGSTAKFL